ncbi:MAG: hypothetical protein K8T26_03040 [Lentisphaerae bacterium]|nr:hypothetical protein [Lentisphaerota bacterium]
MMVYLAVVKVALAWGFLWVIVSGLGLVLRRLFGRGFTSPGDLRLAPWLGWGGVLVILQLWHLARPVNAAALGVVVVAGLAGWLWHARRAGSLLAMHRREALQAALVFGLVALWLANHAVRQPGIYDTGLYHLNAVRWAKEYAIVPGLGNLHGRFAYNNSSFLYMAMLDVGPFLHRAHQVGSGFLMLLFLLQGVHAWRLLWQLREATPASVRFHALATAPTVAWAVSSGYTCSLSPDVPCFLLALLLVGELLALQETSAVATEARAEPLGSVCFLAMIGITVKLSFAVYGVAVGALAFFIVGMRHRRAGAWLSSAALVATLVLLVLVPWSVRGMMISGLPAYPAAFGRLPVDWAVSEQAAASMRRVLLTWARTPGAPAESVLGTWSWFGPWVQRSLKENAFEVTAPLWTALAGVIVAGWRLKRKTLRLRPWTWVVLLPAPCGVVVWFCTAPDPRYLGAMLWAFALGVVVLALDGARPAARAWCAAYAILVLAIFVRPLDLIRTWKDAGPARQVPMKTMVTDSGLAVYVPVTGNQSWDSPLPSTPYFVRSLRLRVPDDMGRGFNRQAASVPLTSSLWEAFTNRKHAAEEEQSHE